MTSVNNMQNNARIVAEWLCDIYSGCNRNIGVLQFPYVG
jgi:hypothetical protein